MGEIAEDMIDGTVCELCGCFFAGEQKPGENRPLLFTHGFPAVCWECWQRLSKRERENRRRATRPTL